MVKRMGWLTLLCLGVALSANAKDYPVNECDRLAANPEDQDVLSPGVQKANVNMPRAIAACETETRLHPDNVRARYQLSRVLAYQGDMKRANIEMKRAADEGYRQAMFVYGLQIDRHRADSPTDVCLVEQYWLKSARLGRQAARVSYVRHAIQGKFDECTIGASPTEMKQFLDAAVPDSSSYYERLLLTDLDAALARWKPPAAGITACDRLASHPEDPDAVAPGVSSKVIDKAKTIAVCKADLEREPKNARLRYQYARVLAYDGQTKLATEEMKRAADDGHRQAQFVYGLFIDRKRPDAPTDVCVAETYFLKAAEAGRQAARLLYVQHVLDDKFTACRHQASPADLSRLLAAAGEDASEFYERLLVDDLKTRLAARSTS